MSPPLSPCLSTFCPPVQSDYIIKEKTVLLQKKDNEGFGFVLRGAKGQSQGGPQIKAIKSWINIAGLIAHH